MFTGIVEEIGLVKKVASYKNLFVLTLQARKIIPGTKKGDSIAIDGVCLTVTTIHKNVLTFDIMKETILKTSLGHLKPKDSVNLERALKRDSRFSGHFVTGHIDHMAVIKAKIDQPNYTEFQIGLTKELKKFIVPKGSIGVDGVSLTIGKVGKNFFSTYLIPFTKKVTTLGAKKVGDFVNLEADILAKYIKTSNKS